MAERLRQFALRFPSCSNSVTTCGAISVWNAFWMNVSSLYELVFNCCFYVLYLVSNRYTVTNLSHLTTVATQTNLHGIVNLNPFRSKLIAHGLCLTAISMGQSHFQDDNWQWSPTWAPSSKQPFHCISNELVRSLYTITIIHAVVSNHCLSGMTALKKN